MQIRKIAVPLVCMLLMSVGPLLAADVAKIGVVDLQKVLKSSDAGKAAQADISKKGNEMKADFEKKGEEIEKLRKEIDRDSLVLDKEARNDREREIRIKINDLKTLQKKYTQEFKRYEARHVKKIQKAIFGIVKKIGEKEGYLMIVENMGVLYYPDSIEITDEVIRIYNAQIAKKK